MSLQTVVLAEVVRQERQTYTIICVVLISVKINVISLLLGGWLVSLRNGTMLGIQYCSREDPTAVAVVRSALVNGCPGWWA